MLPNVQATLNETPNESRKFIREFLFITTLQTINSSCQHFFSLAQMRENVSTNICGKLRSSASASQQQLRGKIEYNYFLLPSAVKFSRVHERYESILNSKAKRENSRVIVKKILHCLWSLTKRNQSVTSPSLIVKQQQCSQYLHKDS